MANADKPQGFQPYGRILRSRRYIAGAACYPGDAVVLSSDGKVDPATAGDGTELLGIAASYAAADLAEVLVWDHPDQMFVVQADETEISSVDLVGNCANIVATAGNSTYKTSRMELDSSDAASNNPTAQLKILGIDRRPDNAYGEFVDVIVAINQHFLAQGATGAAV